MTPGTMTHMLNDCTSTLGDVHERQRHVRARVEAAKAAYQLATQLLAVFPGASPALLREAADVYLKLAWDAINGVEAATEQFLKACGIIDARMLTGRLERATRQNRAT